MELNYALIPHVKMIKKSECSCTYVKENVFIFFIRCLAFLSEGGLYRWFFFSFFFVCGGGEVLYIIEDQHFHHNLIEIVSKVSCVIFCY